ncbi:hypothetical protein [Gaetbulibacter jejuensis]|uniref:Uncharacterized protein n=1 Tax=Gaetbulibacter jejuensis TaxID=584607 RepID=A0ABP3V5N3_9FLAO
MKFNLFICLFFTLNISLCFSQESKFYDENSKEIESLEFYKKCNRLAYKCLRQSTDTLDIYKVTLKYDFGKIEPEEYEQVYKLLIKDTTKSNQIIIVKYIDKLYSFETQKKLHDSHVRLPDSVQDLLKNRYRTSQFKLTETSHNKTIKKSIKKSKKCKKKFEKKHPVNINYMYNLDQNLAEKYKDIDLIQNKGILKLKFLTNVSQFNLLILKPNGEYLLSGGHLSDKSIKELITNDDWSIYKNDLQTTIDKYIINGFGIFEKHNVYYHKDHCF